MIVDDIKNLHRYAVPKTSAILEFIKTHDCKNLPDGEIEIEGRDLFVRVMSYVPKPADENRFEAHQVYADLQFVVDGAEVMQTARLSDLTSITEYDSQGDYQFFKVSEGISDTVVMAHEFTVFYSTEAHRPSCRYEPYQGTVKKLVFKIKMK